MWDTCTWYSMLIAAFFFMLIVPALTFYIGMQYQKTLTVLHDSYISATIKQTGYSPIRYQYESRSSTGVVMPFITSYENKEVLNKVNGHLLGMSNEMTCNPDSGRVGDELKQYYTYTATSSVTYAKNDIYSVSIHSSYFCGGAHPNNDVNESVTFDMKTGELVAFENLFADYEKIKENFVTTMYAPQIAKAELTVDQDTCDSVYTRYQVVTSYYAYTVSDKGLTIEPMWPHVMEACEEAVTVPLSELRDVISPTSILTRMK